MVNGTIRLTVTIEDQSINFKKEITMADRKEEEKRIEKEVYENWRDLSKDHWNHWRAWGSWFSWGSPVGLGLFVVLLALAFVITKFAIEL